MEVEHAGKYKDFGDMFVRSDMSTETREVLDGVLDNMYGNLVARIAAGRKKTADDVRSIIDQGALHRHAGAERAGLVDALKFER